MCTYVQVVSAAVRKDFGRWKAPDDLLLIVSVQQVTHILLLFCIKGVRSDILCQSWKQSLTNGIMSL